MIFLTYPPIWTQSVIDKIWQKHNLAAEEVEETLYDDDPSCIKGNSGTYWVYGHTISGRYIFAVLRKKVGKGRYKVITAREMLERERKYYQQCRKT
jgi:uncharacterized DUF497 family protein